MVGHHNAPKLAHRILGARLVQLLEVLDLGAAQPVGCGANVRALDGLFALQLHASLADAKAVDDEEEVGAVLALQHQQVAKVVAVSFGTRQAHERRLGHAEDGHDDLEEEGGVNVGSFVHQDDIGARATGGLRRELDSITRGGTGVWRRAINVFICFPSQICRPVIFCW